MKKQELLNNLIIPFATNFVAVVLGIAITFAGQKRIDKVHEKEGIMTGLNSVLNGCLPTHITFPKAFLWQKVTFPKVILRSCFEMFD